MVTPVLDIKKKKRINKLLFDHLLIILIQVKWQKLQNRWSYNEQNTNNNNNLHPLYTQRKHIKIYLTMQYIVKHNFLVFS